MKYWINCISKDHVLAGVEGGFTQAGHGKVEPLKQLSKGDIIFFYSSGTTYRGGELLQAFTAAGRVAGDGPYQVTVSDTFRPWRRRVEFVDTEDARIEPLIEQLSFVQDKANWGLALRRGLVAIPEADARTIAAAMKADLG